MVPTPAKRGGEAVGYQGHKKLQTSNLLILTDRQGIPVACSNPIAGNHHDGFQLNQEFKKMLLQIQKSHIAIKGFFLNADSSFDSVAFRKLYQEWEIFNNIDENKRNGNKNVSFFDELLYKQRFVIERTNECLLKCFQGNFGAF